MLKVKTWKRSDTFGNELFITKENEIYIKLATEKRDRHIGTFMPEAKEIIMRREAKHVMLVNNSFGFNHNLLKLSQNTRYIRLITHLGEFLVPLKTILEEGTYLTFSQKGFEVQQFLSITTIKKFEVKSHLF